MANAQIDIIDRAEELIKSLTTERDEARAEVVASAKLARGALNLVRTMLENDPDEPISDAGHTCLEAWVYEADRIDAALSSTAETAARHTETIRTKALEEAAQWHNKKAEELRVRNKDAQALYHNTCASAIRNLAKQEGSK